MMILADFHIHSTFSDGKLSIPELVDLYGSLGFGAIGITDHLCEENTPIGKAARYIGHTLTRAHFPLYQEILKSEAERAWKKYKMVLIPGVELSKNSLLNSRSAHIIGLGISRYIEADQDILSLVREIRNQNGIAIAAHPVSTRKIEKQTFHLWDNREELRKVFDAWEVASGPYLYSEVLATSLPKIANSDFHRMKHLSSWKTVLYCERNQEAILEAIRNQKLEFVFYQAGRNYELHHWTRSRMHAHDLGDRMRNHSLRNNSIAHSLLFETAIRMPFSL